MDLVSKKLAEVLDVEDTINGEDGEESAIGQNPLTNQPVYSSSLVTASAYAQSSLSCSAILPMRV